MRLLGLAWLGLAWLGLGLIDLIRAVVLVPTFAWHCILPPATSITQGFEAAKSIDQSRMCLFTTNQPTNQPTNEPMNQSLSQ
jgi:hypothetical protein